MAPCLLDEYGNNTCKGREAEKNHKCTRVCYGDSEIDYESDHRHSTITINFTFLNPVNLNIIIYLVI